jgi:hypothetical protein
MFGVLQLKEAQNESDETGRKEETDSYHAATAL